MNFPDLPVRSLLPDIVRQLGEHDQLVLEAAPGAGKTTLVPLALMDAPWRNNGKIIVLEPRRVAARAAAERMAELLGEAVGERVGYRIRLEKKVGRNTIIEVVTEGILTRWLQDDPELSGVTAVLFDEFHERNIHSDLGLALCLKAREIFRTKETPLKLLVMSATLDGVAISTLLNNAPVLRSEGRNFDVTIHYGASFKWGEPVVDKVADTVCLALGEQRGDILVFLPGLGEIQRCLASLKTRIGENVVLLPLHGSLTLAEQQKALRPLAEAPRLLEESNKRKVILATDIAETSLTIDGLTTVVDSGLARKPEFDPRTGMTRLNTQRISRASAVQRAGRAGRLGPGHCYRLWSEDQQAQLASYLPPEILLADLAPLMLQLLQWGIADPAELQWLDRPPPAAVNQALDLLEELGAIEQQKRQALTVHGERMAGLPAHPRLAHMLLRGVDVNAANMAAHIAAALAEKNPLPMPSADFLPVLETLSGQRRCEKNYSAWLRRTQQMAKNFLAQIERYQPAQSQPQQSQPQQSQPSLSDENAAAFSLACAYPDRIARRRPGQRGLYQLSNGRSAMLPADDTLANSEWLVVSEIGGTSGHSADRIYSALRLEPALFDHHLAELIREDIVIDWQDGRLVAETRRRLGEIVLERKPAATVSRAQKNLAVVKWLRREGLQVLPWNEQLQQWRSRIALLREQFPDNQPAWPDLSDAALAATMETWLLPFLDRVNNRGDLNKLDLAAILSVLLPWPLPQQLDELAPQKIAVPSGSKYAIDYTQSPPVLEVKLQEMFGAKTTPAIARGKVKLLVHLLSPARRPLQITQDLEGFWNGGYADVKKEMKGRYPKHPWPDNPWEMPATKLTNRRLRDNES